MAAAWIATIIMLVLFIPRYRIREAILVFLFKQLITWLVGLVVVELGLITYPVEVFKNATQTSFSFEYFIYPAICAVFNLNYPEGKSPIRQFMYYFYFCSIMSALEAVVERYTRIIDYVHWTWYITWITLFMTFYFSRKFYIWFFRLNPANQS